MPSSVEQRWERRLVDFRFDGAAGLGGAGPESLAWREWELVYFYSCCRALYVDVPAFSGNARIPRVEMQLKFALRPDSSVVERGPEKAGVGGFWNPLLSVMPPFILSEIIFRLSRRRWGRRLSTVRIRWEYICAVVIRVWSWQIHHGFVVGSQQSPLFYASWIVVDRLVQFCFCNRREFRCTWPFGH